MDSVCTVPGAEKLSRPRIKSLAQCFEIFVPDPAFDAQQFGAWPRHWPATLSPSE
jgi:hypothetical protein